MLPIPQRIAFLLFALVCVGFGAHGFFRLFRRIRAGRADTDARTNNPARRIWYAGVTSLTQSRTFRKRPVVSFLHSWIFYGFAFYILVNLVDAVEGFYPIPIRSVGLAGQLYSLAADVFSLLVLLAVVALVLRRFALPSRRDFNFNARTLLHPKVRRDYITRDSLIVSAFILFHVGSRAAETGAKLALAGPDAFQPFATLLSHAIPPQHAFAVRDFGYWGALGSVLAFLIYFPYSKHIHIFLAPLKYAVAREVPSGVLPPVDLTVDIERHPLGAAKLEDLAWPRLLDAYACIQCNRCQDVCPATATGKSLSPSALEINKRMELNQLGLASTAFETGLPSPRPLLEFALTPEAAWACTTCGACMQVCPVQDEPMLDIVDIRRRQVMMEGNFPSQLQSAFRGMERAKNPWGIAQESRLAWANGLRVPTIDENPTAEVLYWVGCAASYDPQAQKTARALVQLLGAAGVSFAVLGNKECCTGDSARRAGNEFLYQQLAEQNIRTLREHAPKLILASCPHCLNAVGKEYAQLGGSFTVMHHTEYLDQLIQQGRLKIPSVSDATISFHDPCYLGRHNGVYEPPRNLLRILSNDVRELERSRENSFCCGAGGAQFWKEEEPGDEKISVNRLREAERVLATGSNEKVLAVGCPFCKSMLQSSATNQGQPVVMDVAELLWRSLGDDLEAASLGPSTTAAIASADWHGPSPQKSPPAAEIEPAQPAALGGAVPAKEAAAQQRAVPAAEITAAPAGPKRQKWSPAKKIDTTSQVTPPYIPAVLPNIECAEKSTEIRPDSSATAPATPPPERKKWPGKRKAD